LPGKSRGTARDARPQASLLVIAALILVALGVGSAAWLLWGSAAGGRPAPTAALTQPPLSAEPTRDPLEPLTIASVQRWPHLVFQNVVRGDDYAKTALVPLDSPGGMRLASELVCERVHFAAGHGVCLTAEHEDVSTYFAVTFNGDYRATARIELDGAPTYGRVSPDGRLASASFQTSPPTAQMPFAPTETWILETSTGEVLADLADFTLLRDGQELSPAEVDYWGVTFMRDGDGFYTSVRFDGNNYLARGSLDEQRLDVLDSGVSAPALSPDETRIAFARLVSNIGPTWRFHVLDLDTGALTQLSEATSIDDQMEWMGDSQLLYGLATDIWRLNADGTGNPQPFVFGGLSPAVVEPSR
jgi:hypothetical protein